MVMLPRVTWRHAAVDCVRRAAAHLPYAGKMVIRRLRHPDDRLAFNVTPLNHRSPTVKKGRHRRFEEARKLKQSGPAAFGFGPPSETRHHETEEEDEYAALAEKYNVPFDDDDDDDLA
jgi:hypothetical protein